MISSSIPPAAAASATAARPARTRRPLRTAFVLLIFAISLVPAIATIWTGASSASDLLEMRPLAPLPTHWEGRWFDFDKNYRNFEKGYSDHLGLRSLMVRTKNELDFRLFNSSRRVYFGKQDEIYGHKISDIELPATEHALDTPAKAEAVYSAIRQLAARLEAQGTTLVLLTPISKQYFTQDRIPRFMPRLPQQSHFMQLYRRFQQTPEFHFVDVQGIMAASQGKFPLFFRQDFHWTDLSALKVAEAATNTIASLEGLPPAWRHELAYHDEAFEGSESRFAGLLSSKPLQEPMLTKTWQDVHQTTPMDAHQTGFEFITDSVKGRGLLPPTCLYGNSFGDGMTRAGLQDHFEQFLRLDREMFILDTPQATRGRCKYLIVQMLDSSAGIWIELAK
ncbi:hypothetical protein GTP81_26085 [Rugamonas sp. FT107W]|uniref:AlgX/AlgJ SGNH hydrolase-like domain-containing protein n=1 Tax=Duganella vulcania TaxID=2692166 RepID=A0A845HS23_9BURK|nr:hypothetical protein [Duganella vulcania]MYN20219.1 hypothetical protein [Duganella vulcania]